MADAPTVETEAQKRRRLRQERILNRGSDRLNRIKGTFSQVQEESDKVEMGIVGGHELITSSSSGPEAASSPHAAGISLESVGDSQAGSEPVATRPRRRVGNLARKAAALEGATEQARTSAHAINQATQDPTPANSIGSEGSNRRPRPAVNVADINSDALHESLSAAIADPAAESTTSPSTAAVTGALNGGLLAARRFSAIGLSRAVFKLIPVAGVFIYGLNRESRYARFMGDSEDDTQAKWAGLMAARPDDRLAEWSSGNYLLWYLIILELAMYAAYFVLSDRPPRPANTMLAHIPGMPRWPLVVLSAGNRILDSLSILLFLTAVCIFAS